MFRSASAPNFSLVHRAAEGEGFQRLQRVPSCLQVHIPGARVRWHKRDRDRLTQVDDFNIKRPVGEGSMGKVYLGVHNKTGERVAIKVVLRPLPVGTDSTFRSQQRAQKVRLMEDRIMREANLLRIMRHPHIVQVTEFRCEPQAFYLFMEYMEGGQLLDYIIDKRRLDEREARHFARQLASALDYLHRNSIVHRDLKIENIMLDKAKRNLKLVDFGLASMFRPEGKLETYCGSLYFAAPELLTSKPYCGPEIDIWSFGCVIYCMVSGSVPFDDPCIPRLHDKIKRGICPFPAFVTVNCVQLLRRMLHRNPEKRIKLADVMRHEWLNRGYKYSVKNYLPIRMPIIGDIPPRMLEYMSTNLRLGSEDSIAGKWTFIMGSKVHKRLSGEVAEIRFEASKNQTVTEFKAQPYDDPQYVVPAYHPIVSAYHLYTERVLGIELQQQPDIPDDFTPDHRLYGDIPGYHHEPRFKPTPYPANELFNRRQMLRQCSYSDTDSSSCDTASPTYPSTPKLQPFFSKVMKFEI